jgi:serine/threonine kinase PknH
LAIFITYSSRDEAAVAGLLTALRQAHEQIWLDEQLAGGQQWWGVILEQIRASDVFVIAFSQHWINSKPCQAEFDYARALNKSILPVQVGPVDSMRANPLASTQIIDFQSPDTAAGIQLMYALNASRDQGTPLPNPLPPEPPVPYEYLARLHELVSSREQLDPHRQDMMIAEFRQRFVEDGSDPGACADLERLLQTVWGRMDLVPATRTAVETLIEEVRQRSARHVAAAPAAATPVPASNVDVPAKSSRLLWGALGTVAAVAAVAIAAVVLVSGRDSPPASAPAASSAGPPSTTTSAAPTGVTLPANSFGYVAVATKMLGGIRCQLKEDNVGCESQFFKWPKNGVEITPDGNIRFWEGNLGESVDTPMDYQTYHAVGWTVTLTARSLTIVNDHTGRGAVLTPETVTRL